MLASAKGIRPFLGAKDFDVSRAFYRELGFREVVIAPEMSVFHLDGTSFYLQRYYAKDWVDNTMVFLEVEDLDGQLRAIIDSGVVDRYDARVSEISDNDWGREFFLHDPSGILWHIGTFAP
ncbi:MAG: glyoxalase [Aureliella sp.]